MSTHAAAARLQSLLVSLNLEKLPEEQAEAFAVYFSLLQKWNAKVNLTAIRDEAGILRRHFVESIQCARLLPDRLTTLLDYGSGAGFPGIPIAICRPEVTVTLADSQAKKAAFLREAVRTLNLSAIVYAGRVEGMPRQQTYSAVSLRAVDRMQESTVAALARLTPGGWLALLVTRASAEKLISEVSTITWQPPVELAGTTQEILLLGRLNVGC